jgi:electron transfer flavoprotein beta subunit
MNVLVCIKQILDPEIPTRDFRVDPERKEAVRGGANLVTNIFCENALETALQLRERAGGSITVLSYGPESAEESLRKALAMKADRAAMVIQEGQSHPGPLVTARVLAAAADKLGPFDLIMVGRESGDWGDGQTGGLLAEELKLPCVSFVDTIEPASGSVKLKRQTDAGWESVEATLPLVVTITNDEHNVPRVPKTRDIMMSFRQPITKWTLGDLGLEESADQPGYYEIVDLFIPKHETRCELVSGDSLEERVGAFAERIAEVLRSF